jgi:hypothetical protein
MPLRGSSTAVLVQSVTVTPAASILGILRLVDELNLVLNLVALCLPRLRAFVESLRSDRENSSVTSPFIFIEYAIFPKLLPPAP